RLRAKVGRLRKVVPTFIRCHKYPLVEGVTKGSEANCRFIGEFANFHFAYAVTWREGGVPTICTFARGGAAFLCIRATHFNSMYSAVLAAVLFAATLRSNCKHLRVLS